MQPDYAVQDHRPLYQLAKAHITLSAKECLLRTHTGLATLQLGLKPTVHPNHSLKSPPPLWKGSPGHFIIAVLIARPCLESPLYSGDSAKAELPGVKQHNPLDREIRVPSCRSQAGEDRTGCAVSLKSVFGFFFFNLSIQTTREGHRKKTPSFSDSA